MAVNIFERLAVQVIEQALGFGIGGAIQPAITPFVADLTQEFWQLHPVLVNSPEALASMVVQGILEERAAATEAARSGLDADRFHELVKVNGEPIAPEQAFELWNRGELSEADVERALLQSRLKPEWVEQAKLLARQIPQLADLAQMVVQGVLSDAEATRRAHAVGYSPEDFALQVRLAGSPLAPEQALELWNRGELAEADVERALLQSRLKPEWVAPFKLLARTNPQLADLAEMVVQGILSEPQASERAAQLGVTEPDFALLVRLAGNPPGPETVLELWNRGIIDEPAATRALLQSRLKPEWVEPFKASRFAPVSPATAAEAVIKQRIPLAEGERIAAAHGVNPEAFQLLVDAGGRPLAEGQALTLYRRGLFTADQVKEAIYRSNIRSEYAADILELATVYPSLYQVKQILATGAIDDATAREILRKEGYTAAVVEGIIAAAHGVKLAKQKELSQAAVSQLYQERAIDQAEATHLLEGLGYDHNDAALILGLADYNANKAYRSAVLAVVRARYLAGDIDEPTASAQLDRIGLAPEERDQYLDLWRFDLQANPRLLTLAELNLAVKRGLLDQAAYVAYLGRLGFVEPEVSLLAALYVPGYTPS